ncbi:MAG: UbiA prenyltransferase family protein [Nitrospinae bacterium]|nr:UbiA prenyltransferase family protein [Nitrospinota bacterium]
MNVEKIIGHIKLIRLPALIWFDLLSSLGMACMSLRDFPPPFFFLLIVAILFADAGSSTLNDIGDIDADRLSEDPNRLNRPLVTGVIDIRTAWMQAVLLLGTALIIASQISLSVFIIILIGIILTIMYSLPPAKLNGRSWVTQPFWILFWMGYYLLVLLFLEGIDMRFVMTMLREGGNAVELLHYRGTLFTSSSGWIFIAAIICFMGVAEIMAKDLRDIKNDIAAGRHTWVGRAGVQKTTRIIPPFAILGITLWGGAFYFGGVIAHPSAWLVLVIGIIWTVRLTLWCRDLRFNYSQRIAASLHKRWLITYGIMQALTITIFLL